MDNRAENIEVEQPNTGAGTTSGPDFILGQKAQQQFNLSFILERAKSILMDPDRAWPSIKQADESINEIYRGYFMHIAAVSAICRFLETMSGHFFFSLVAAAISWAVSLAMVYVMAMIIEAIAPKFGSTGCSRTDAVRLLAYSATPGMLVAPIIGLLPWTLFSFIAGLVGLYGLVVLYKGITPVTGIPEQKRLVFTLTCIAAAVVLSMVVFAILGPVLVVTPQIAANM